MVGQDAKVSVVGGMWVNGIDTVEWDFVHTHLYVGGGKSHYTITLTVGT